MTELRTCAVCGELLTDGYFRSRWTGEFMCPPAGWVVCEARGRRQRLEAAAAASKLLAAIGRAQKADV